MVIALEKMCMCFHMLGLDPKQKNSLCVCLLGGVPFPTREERGG